MNQMREQEAKSLIQDTVDYLNSIMMEGGQSEYDEYTRCLETIEDQLMIYNILAQTQIELYEDEWHRFALCDLYEL